MSANCVYDSSRPHYTDYCVSIFYDSLTHERLSYWSTINETTKAILKMSPNNIVLYDG